MTDTTRSEKNALAIGNHDHSISRRKFITRMIAFTGCAAAGLLLENSGSLSTVLAQGGPNGGGPGGGPGGNDNAALAEAFKGITADGTVVPNLYPVKATGVSTDAVRKGADDFLAALTDAQRQATVFTVDDEEWRKWSNIDSYQRQGVSLEAMSEAQRTAAFNLLGAALSVKGLQLARDVMRLNTTEGELMNNLKGFNEFLYYFTVMGTPSATEPWGFQVDGHHLVINYFILGDQVVMAPVFMGAEPPVATTGQYSGVSVLQTEQSKGLAMINALTDDQRKKAIIQVSKTGNNNLAEAFKDNVVIAYAGLLASELSVDQQTQFLDLIAEWVNNMDDGHAKVKMEEVQSHLGETYFAWVGDIGPEAVFYYRIQSPVILIEFDHAEPGPLGNYQGLPRTPSRHHIHSVVRTPNGNDYGKDLLRQHYLTHPHTTATTTKAAS